LSTSKNWSSRLNEFKKSDNPRAIFEIAVTAIPLVLLWFGMWKALQAGGFIGYLDIYLHPIRLLALPACSTPFNKR